MTAPYSSPSFRSLGRAYWLPPWGIGNGLDAETWAEIAEVPESDVKVILDSLREAGIPAHAACRTWHEAQAPFRIWVGTWYYSRAQTLLAGPCSACSGVREEPTADLIIAIVGP